VQEDHPRVYVHSPLPGGRTEVAKRVARPRELGHARLKSQILVARPVRLEEDSTALQVPYLMGGVVGKEIPGVVVGDRHRQPVYSRPFLEVAEDYLEPLVVKVGSEREH
jgi:hypothetical protein